MTDQSTNAPDFGMNAEVASGPSLSYWQLVRKRFIGNRYGMIGMIICLAIVFTAVFAPFLSPYTPATKDRTAIYTPPQILRVISEDGGLTRPFVLGFAEEMDPNTYEITFQASHEQRVDLALFVQGPEYTFLGMDFTTHFIGGVDGAPVHFLGTDGLGRDVFSRMLYGSRITLMMGFIVMCVACVIGTIVGVTSGYLGGTTDTIIQRVIEFVKSFPDLPLYLALVAVLPRRADPMLTFLMFAGIVILLQWANLARELRGKVIAIRSVEFVRAAVAVGADDKRIILRHIIPNMSSHIIVWATYVLPEVILLESFLSFLGVGIQQPMVSWGVMLNAVRDFQSLASAPWLLAPVGMIILSVLAFNALGDGLRDAMDPYAND